MRKTTRKVTYWSQVVCEEVAFGNALLSTSISGSGADVGTVGWDLELGLGVAGALLLVVLVDGRAEGELLSAC